MFDDDLVGQTTLPFSVLAQDQLTKLQHLPTPAKKTPARQTELHVTSFLSSNSRRGPSSPPNRSPPTLSPPTSAARKIPNTGRHRAAAAHQTGPRFAVQCIQWQRRRIAKPGGTSLRRRCATLRRASPAPPSLLASGELPRRLRATTSPRPSSAALAPPPTDPTAPAPVPLHPRGVAATASSSGRLSPSLLLVREVICSW